MSVRPSLYVCLSACISEAPGRIFMKYDGGFVRKYVKTIKKNVKILQHHRELYVKN